MRKTEYISTEYNRFTQKADKAESRIGHNLKKLFKEEDLYRDRDSQIKAIEETFEAAKKPVSTVCVMHANLFSLLLCYTYVVIRGYFYKQT